jgi:hypothetical protein
MRLGTAAEHGTPSKAIINEVRHLISVLGLHGEYDHEVQKWARVCALRPDYSEAISALIISSLLSL